MKRRFQIHLVLLAMLFIAGACGSSETSGSQNASETGSVKKEAYKCPMACEGDKTYENAGQCPVCKMDLEKV